MGLLPWSVVILSLLLYMCCFRFVGGRVMVVCLCRGLELM